MAYGRLPLGRVELDTAAERLSVLPHARMHDGISFDEALDLFLCERHAVHPLAAKVVVLVVEERAYAVERHSHHSVGRVVKRHEELLLLAVDVDGDRPSTVGVEISERLLAVRTDSFSLLEESLLDRFAGDRQAIEIQCVLLCLLLLHCEDLDLHLGLLS